MIQLANYKTKILKLKYPLYPNYDGDLVPYKQEYDYDMPILKAGTLWKICTKEEYCKLEKYNEEDTKDLMVACGALISILAFADKENGVNKETFKKMINGYIDCIYDGKLPDGIFVKKKGKKEE